MQANYWEKQVARKAVFEHFGENLDQNMPPQS